MPELPEVETVVQSIKGHLLGESFTEIVINWPKTLHNFDKSKFNEIVAGKKIIDIKRRAKYIIICFESSLLAIHLRMTGKLYAVNTIDLDKKHVSLYLKFGKKYLIYEDTRKFGRFYLYNDMIHLDNKLGVEPLELDFTKEWIVENMRQKKRQIKALLFDQSFICGLGNIYIDEALWHAKIHPLSISNNISIKKLHVLRSAIIKVLSDSIELGGSSIRDFTYNFKYVGNYALNLKVFGKQGTECQRCQTLIVKCKVSQRGTHYCPKCQRR
jgi:formamidopyrimidine-DNA glycosylase